MFYLEYECKCKLLLSLRRVVTTSWSQKRDRRKATSNKQQTARSPWPDSHSEVGVHEVVRYLENY